MQECYEYVNVNEIKQEVDVKIENEEVKEEEDLKRSEEYVQEIKQEEELIIKDDYDESYCDPADKSYEKDINEDQDETYTEELDNPSSSLPVKSTSFQIEAENSKQENGFQILRGNFQCTYCNQAFTTEILLQQHFAIHGKKKFSCSICGKRFFSKDLLDKHSKV